MPLDPRLQPMCDAMAAMPAPPEGMSAQELRAFAHAAMEQGYTALAEPGPSLPSVEDIAVNDDVTVRVYTPDGDPSFPAHLYVHGGGFWLGTLDHFDAVCRWTAQGAGCLVASVDYRLAPEHPFPAAPEDCYAALCWLADRPDVDAGRISVGGASAGGNLAAVVSLMARDRGGPSLVFQVLEIPVTDLTMSYPSVVSNGEGYMLTRKGMEQYVGFYATEQDRTNPYASPIFAEDLTGLPPALVMTAEFDPLRDEGEAYAERLRAAGVPVTSKRWEGQIHGSQWFDKLLPDEARAYREVVNATLREAYSVTRSPTG